MKKLNDKLIHLLGGLTEEDMRLRTRPVISKVSRYCMRTIAVRREVNPEIIRTYPEYMDLVGNDMACRIADKMLQEKLIDISSKQEAPDRIIVSATARVYVPEV